MFNVIWCYSGICDVSKIDYEIYDVGWNFWYYYFLCIFVDFCCKKGFEVGIICWYDVLVNWKFCVFYFDDGII